MGNAISGLAPFAVGTGIIGIISFLFTLLTAFRVFWQNLRTIGNANSEVKIFLPNLKQALYEERAHLRMIRRRCRGQYEEGGFRILAESIREMLSEFQHLQTPFLAYPDPSSRARRTRRGSGGSPPPLRGLRAEREKARAFAAENGTGDRGVRAGGGGVGGGGGGGRRDRDRSRSRSDDGAGGHGKSEWSDDYMNTHFRAESIWARTSWLYRRSRFLELSDRLSKIQGRRSARQTTDICIDTRYVARTISELQDRLEGLERRVQRL